MNRSEEITSLSSALCKARLEMQNPVKDKSGYGYKYADLGQLLDICMPILCKHGVFLSQPVSFEEGRVVIETVLMHGNEYMSERVSLPVLQGKQMNEVQAIGSVITYGRRYALSSMLGIAQEDLDASDLRPKTPCSVISEDQAQIIQAMANEVGADLDKTCKYFKIAHISQLPLKHYDQVMQKMRKIKESGGEHD